MPRASKSGVRGLYGSALAGYHIDLRWRDPKTGAGKRYRERLPPGSTAPAAKARAREILAAALAGTFDPHREDTPRVTLSAARDAYLEHTKATRPKTHKDKRGHLASFCTVLGAGKYIDALSPFDVQRFIRDRRERGAAPATVNRAITTLRHMLRYARSRGWVTSELVETLRSVERLREPRGRVRFLHDDEWARLSTALESTERLGAIVRVALLSGMRRSELLTLRRSQVDLARREIVLSKTKNGRERTVRVNDALAAELDAALRRDRGNEHLFVSRLGEPYDPDAISRMFARACARADVTNLRFHDLRHDFATRLRRRGVALDALAKLLGHSSLEMVTRYAHLGDETLRQAVEGLELPSAAPAALSALRATP